MGGSRVPMTPCEKDEFTMKYSKRIVLLIICAALGIFNWQKILCATINVRTDAIKDTLLAAQILKEAQSYYRHGHKSKSCRPAFKAPAGRLQSLFLDMSSGNLKRFDFFENHTRLEALLIGQDTSMRISFTVALRNESCVSFEIYQIFD